MPVLFATFPAGARFQQLRSLALLLLAAALTAPQAARACTSIIVGRNASADGSIMIARTVDMPPGFFQPQVLVHRPFRAGNATFKSNSNKLSLALPAPGVAYHSFPLIQAAQSKWGIPSFEEAGVNVYGAFPPTVSSDEPAAARPRRSPCCLAGGGTPEHVQSLQSSVFIAPGASGTPGSAGLVCCSGCRLSRMDRGLISHQCAPAQAARAVRCRRVHLRHGDDHESPQGHRSRPTQHENRGEGRQIRAPPQLAPPGRPALASAHRRRYHGPT